MKQLFLIGALLGAFYFLFGVITHQQEHKGFGLFIACICLFAYLLMVLSSEPVKSRVTSVLKHIRS